MRENCKVWGSLENASSAVARRVAAVGIDSTDKLPCKTRRVLSLDDPSRIINFGHPGYRSHFIATADSQSTTTDPTQGIFPRLMLPTDS